MILKKLYANLDMRVYGVAVLCMMGVLSHQLCATTDLVTAIEQRYYMIKRLEKPIDTLIKAYQKKITLQVPKGSANLFKDPLVHRTFVAMERTQSTMPFYKLWSSFLAYQFVENKEFINEILTAILLLYKDLILSMRHEPAHKQKLLQSIDTYLPNKSLCPTIDCHELNAALTSHHTIESVYPTEFAHSIEEHIDTIRTLLDQDEMDSIATDNTMRFYYIQRLLKSMFILSRQKGPVPFLFDETVCNNLTCPSIKACVQALVAQKSMVPLFEVWAQITAYDFINDTHYVREFVLVAYLAYRQMLDTLHPSSAEQPVRAKDVLAMYEKIATLPVADLLDLLDDVVEQYDTLAQQYALKDSSLSWKQWFEKYWWSAPVVVGSFITTLLKHSKVLLASSTTNLFKKEANCVTL